MSDIKQRIANDFTYHTPPPERRDDFVKLREKAKELALLIAELTPSGREQSTSLTRLEEAVFHANAGIARQYPHDSITVTADANGNISGKVSVTTMPVKIIVTNFRSTHLNYVVDYRLEDSYASLTTLNIPAAVIHGNTMTVEQYVNQKLSEKFGTNLLITHK